MSDTHEICVGIVMDGNRRWAKEQGLSMAEGHEAGARKIEEVVEWAQKNSIAHLYLYAFSTENWYRAPEEVEALLALFDKIFAERMRLVEDKNVRIRFIGERTRFSGSLQKKMSESEERSQHNTSLTCVFCLSYGGRSEIAHAATRLASEGKTSIDEHALSSRLWTAGMPDPDLILRPGGEKRLSNFLLWQSAYAELFFTDTLWPDLSEGEFQSILSEYATRARRRGR
jgi:undecaprenyl diphosphate synthase